MLTIQFFSVSLQEQTTSSTEMITDCSVSKTITCSQIRNLPLLEFLGAGEFKASYLTSYLGDHYVLRLPTRPEEHKKEDKPFKSFQRKRNAFEREWAKLQISNQCQGQLPFLYGTCDEPDVVADVMERIFTFDIIDEMFREKSWKTEWWCWPLKWIIDILDLLAFTSERKEIILLEPLYYRFFNEFGISSLTGILKQPDLGQFNVKPSSPWVNLCCHQAGINCAYCQKIDSWRQSECLSLQINGEIQPNDCNDHSKEAHSRMEQRFVYDTIVRHLFSRLEELLRSNLTNSNEERTIENSAKIISKVLSGDDNDSIDFLVKFTHFFFLLFESSHYINFPQPSKLLSELNTFWGKEGPKCILRTSHDMMNAVEEKQKSFVSISQKRMENNQFLQKITGKTLQYRLDHYPYDT